MGKTIKDYFDIRELVDKTVFDRFGQSAWKFIDKDLLACLLFIREALGKPMTINNWHKGGQFSQRGLRTNISPMVQGKTGLYLSAHLFGKGSDFDVAGMTAVEVRLWIVANAEKLPCKIRLERNMKGKPINWVHLDTLTDETQGKVLQFDV
jgi:hypothetical protein